MKNNRDKLIHDFLDFSLTSHYIEKHFLNKKRKRKKNSFELLSKNSYFIVKQFEDFINSPHFTSFELRFLKYNTSNNTCKDDKYHNEENEKLLKFIEKILKISKSLNLSKEQYLELNKLINLISSSKNNLDMNKLDFFLNNLDTNHFLDFKNLKSFLLLLINSS